MGDTGLSVANRCGNAEAIPYILVSLNKGNTMNCWHCKTELIWGGDNDCEDGAYGDEKYSIETNLSCPKCNSAVLVYYPREPEDGE